MPKEFDSALKKRTKYAEELNEACCDVDTFIQQFKLEPSLDDCVYLTGCEIYINPRAAETAIRRAFNEKYDKKEN